MGDEIETGPDQTSAVSGTVTKTGAMLVQPRTRIGRGFGDELDRHLETIDEAPAERDEAGLVAVHRDIASVCARPHDPRVSVEVTASGERGSLDVASARDEHRVVGPDLAAGTGQPAQDIGMRGATEPVGAATHDLVAIAVGQHVRVAGELDHGARAIRIERQDLDTAVDRREAPVGRGFERVVQRMHRRQITVGRMRVDVMTYPRPLREMGDLGRRSRAAGFDGMLLTEGGRSVYTCATAVALAEPDLELSTGVAVAFPRSPMITAQAAWEIHEASGGGFRLGLGTQVKTHVVRRFGMEFDRPGPRMRDYLLAVKACFAAFRGAPLDHHGEFYELTFLSRQWSPGPIDAPDPKVDVAAVNPWMLRMAGEVADGVHLHPIAEPGYIERHAVPNVVAGAERAGRDPDEIDLILPVTTIVGDTDEEFAVGRDLARRSLSFYGSTPNYAFVWDEAGFEGTTARIHEKQRAGDFAGMAAEITDDHLAMFCTESSWERLADALIDAYGSTVARLVFYSPALDTPERFERYGAVARDISERTSG